MTPAELALIGITPEQIAHAFAWGFMAVFGSWLAGYGAQLAIALIRKI